VSIAALVEAGLLPAPAAVAPPVAAPSTALAFAFDAGYRLPFKVMLASMARAGTMLDAPIHVFSLDPSLLDDPFVRAATDRFVLIEGPLLEELSHLAEHSVRRPERADWNRGTFLKWAIFQPADVEQILFLDVDMLCLAPLEPLLMREPGTPLVGCPQFPRSLVSQDDVPLPQAVASDRLERMLAGTIPEKMGRLNSGVMLVRRPLLDDALRHELIAHARTILCVNEQSHLTAFFRGRPGSMALIESAWNFHESYLKRAEPAAAARILGQVRILHYPGTPKPWMPTDRPVRRASFALWGEIARQAGLV
jgi:lipopolysaccharide biosynthesis glycosyltransferase